MSQKIRRVDVSNPGDGPLPHVKSEILNTPAMPAGIQERIDYAFGHMDGELADKVRGRQKWLRQRLLYDYGIKVSAEAVSQWFKGRRPHPEVIEPMASILKVDPGWLYTGYTQDHIADPGVSSLLRGERVKVQPGAHDPNRQSLPTAKPRNPQAAESPAAAKPMPRQSISSDASLAKSVRDAIAGAIRLTGGMVAFPGGDTDMLAFVNGKSFAMSVIPGTAAPGGKIEFTVPGAKAQGATLVGVAQLGDTGETAHVRIDNGLLMKRGTMDQNGNWSILVEMKDGALYVGNDRLPALLDFTSGSAS